MFSSAVLMNLMTMAVIMTMRVIEWLVIFCDTHDNPSQIVKLTSWHLWSWQIVTPDSDSLCDPLQSILGSTWKNPFWLLSQNDQFRILWRRNIKAHVLREKINGKMTFFLSCVTYSEMARHSQLFWCRFFYMRNICGEISIGLNFCSRFTAVSSRKLSWDAAGPRLLKLAYSKLGKDKQ